MVYRAVRKEKVNVYSDGFSFRFNKWMDGMLREKKKSSRRNEPKISYFVRRVT